MPRTFAVAALVAIASCCAARAEPGWFTTAQGVRIETPAVADLPCGRMRGVLDAIDASLYRGDAPQPRETADTALFEYENRLSTAYYAECVRPMMDEIPPAAAFAAGFERGDP
jgi:hypothetical protein